MATWNDVKLWMTSQNIVFTDFGDYIDANFTYVGKDRSQWVRLSHNIIDDGTDTVALISGVAPYDPLKTEALLLAAFSGVGGLAIQETSDGGRYFVLQTTVPLADLDSSELSFHIKIIGIRADFLEAEIFRVDRM